MQSYIVYLGSHSHGTNPSLDDFESVTNSHYDLLGSYMGSLKEAKEAIFYSYTRHINGFAAVLEEEAAAEIAKNPKVVSVFLNKGLKLHTTHSWGFLGLERNGVIPRSSLWERARFGEDVIIGNLDTGVWPESKSFSDEGIGPVPSKWRGTCELDSDNSNNFHCNRKLVGARYFNKGYQAYVGKQLNASSHSARDSEGHGSHTLSTAGGNFVPGVSIVGNGNGTASGGSPKARVAAYKVCWPLDNGVTCFDADVLAGFEAAISDGVDVLSVSLGGEPEEFFQDSMSIGAFHAVANGIVVVKSAGNSGPSPGSVSGVSPWLLTVAASTNDREFSSYATLGDNKSFRGDSSLYSPALPNEKLYPLINAADAKLDNAFPKAALFCEKGTLDSNKVKGKILFCLRGDGYIAEKGEQAALGGAVGMILADNNINGNEVITMSQVLPTIYVNFTDGQYILNYINETKSPMAYISRVKTELGIKPAPAMASFSSRGPNVIEPTILKPDITAPGVNIIAAFTEETSDNCRVGPFNILSGTSMSCPHVSGIAGLLKTLHPDWSPAAIKSAIMTTARRRDNTEGTMKDSAFDFSKATPFAYGSGHVWPNRAADPGLVYDLNTTDYLNFLCARGYDETKINAFYNNTFACPKSYSLTDFNYPSISIPGFKFGSTVNVIRTVTNVGSASTYSVRVKQPRGVLVSVEPSLMSFNAMGEKKEFKVTLQRQVESLLEQNLFGELDWTDGKHHVRSPIVIMQL
ncbi:hypothetical protein L6164_005860 [Bauhinia variegata]|uniref:Uncharacterized protein n=1 Tax=Bauhinia variegata TaxID=167791 RepID=A0ACB9PRQ2_BAUVA|nr:hypothetical protein L6164_005860 [Bauhinia variegata]